MLTVFILFLPTIVLAASITGFGGVVVLRMGNQRDQWLTAEQMNLPNVLLRWSAGLLALSVALMWVCGWF